MRDAADRLANRADVAAFAREILAPLPARFSPARASIALGAPNAEHDLRVCGLEAFARPLWALAPLAAAGEAPAEWLELWRDGLRAGPDPTSAEYWGAPRARDQRIVEAGTIAAALLIAPRDLVWALDDDARNRLAAWLQQALIAEAPRSNWQLFHLVIASALERLTPETAGLVAERRRTAMAKVDALSRTDGWYDDAGRGACDHYQGYSFHFYGLLLGRLRGVDPDAASRLEARARAFAPAYRTWFGSDGASLPIGRSLSYRFAAASFWGALAFAGVEALPWGEIKGLYLRHLRWWARQGFRAIDGTLPAGYAYPNDLVAEQYIGPGSPYWACKAFLPLALPESHPFWSAEELPYVPLLTPQSQPESGLVIFEAGSQRIALNAGAGYAPCRQAAAKYGKLAYATAFGPLLAPDPTRLADAGIDNALAFSEDGETWHSRRRSETAWIADGRAHGRWSPMPGTAVQTTLIAVPPWHLRVHDVTTDRTVTTVEGGFAVGYGDEGRAVRREIAPALAAVLSERGFTGLRDLTGDRDGRIVGPVAGASLLEPRALVPMLHGKLGPGQHRLVAAVLALPDWREAAAAWRSPPAAP